MSKTLAEKLLNQESGNIVIARVDLVFAQDTTGPLTVRQFQACGFKRLAHPKKTALFFDHAAPSPNQEISNDHKLLRQFAGESQQVAVIEIVGHNDLLAPPSLLDHLHIASPGHADVARMAAVVSFSTQALAESSWHVEVQQESHLPTVSSRGTTLSSIAQAA